MSEVDAPQAGLNPELDVLSAATDDGPAASSGRPLPPGPVPRGVSLSAFYGGVVAVLVVALGLAAICEAVLTWGLVEGTRPTAWLTDTIDVIEPVQPVFWISVALVVGGLLIFFTALRRRPVRAYQLKASTGVYLRHIDAAHLLEHDLHLLPGVVGVRVTAKAKKLVVQVKSTGAQETSDTVRRAVEQRLAALQSPPTVRYETAVARAKDDVS